MTKQVQAGADALTALNQSDDNGGNKQEFASFKSGESYTVKALGTADLITFYSYGIYNVINSFVAENPSKKSAKGFPVENLTVWDKAWRHHADQSEQFQDEQSQEAYKYRAKQRFALGFIDLDTGEPIIVDVSRNQAQVLHGAINENADKLGRLSFQLSKQGTGTKTTVSLRPYVDVEMVDKLRKAEIDVEDDLTAEQRKHFDGAPDKFDMTLFDGLLYEMDEEEQLETLVRAGFDISLIGLDAPKAVAEEGTEVFDGADIEESELPF